MLARRSVAITGAPLSFDGPRTTAVAPFIRISAPIRASSCACMNRFSKIVSVMTEVPSACVSIAIICACKSVGNPGYGSVRSSTEWSRPLPRATRRPLPIDSTTMPASRNFVATASRCAIGALVIVTSPPVIAAAAIIDPASIRSGITSCSAPCSRSTPSTSITCVPAPLIFAPILTSTRARSCTSGSRAAFSITVRPRAVDAAIKMFSVAPTDGESSQMRPPVSLSAWAST